LTLEIVEAVTAAWTADRVGLRLSPSATVNGVPDHTGHATFIALFGELARVDLAYTHLTRATAADRARGSGPGLPLRELRASVHGALIGTGDFTQAEAADALSGGWLDAVGFGRAFLANPICWLGSPGARRSIHRTRRRSTPPARGAIRTIHSRPTCNARGRRSLATC
jgi:N-ethylmaleimide reductase